MNEQSANNVGNYLSKKVGNKKKVVVVHPDKVSRLIDLQYTLCEGFVYSFVSCPKIVG